MTVKLLDPVRLFGEGQYNLNNMKEISVTDSFLGLKSEIRNCQNNEAYNDCKTRLYVENFKRQCGCLPLPLKLSDKGKKKSKTLSSPSPSPIPIAPQLGIITFINIESN